MRLLAFYVDGFGILHDVSIETISPGLSIFLGDNEAGKTTCLSFLRDIFFGFPDGRSKENSYSPLAGGQHGGRLILHSDRLGEVLLERRPGKRGGVVTIMFEGGAKGGEEDLHQLLGGVTREVFKNIYAFSLSELQQIETLDNDRVKAVLYGATAGTVSLPTALSGIEAKLTELYRPGGSKPIINEKLKSLENVRMQLRTARKDMGKYEEECGFLAEKEKKIKDLRDDEILARRKKDRVDALLRLWEDWMELRDFEEKMGNLALHIDVFPETGLARLNALVDKIEANKQLLQEHRNEGETYREESDALQMNELLLQQSQLVQDLLSQKSMYLREQSGIPVANQKIESLNGSIDTILADLGAEWTEEKVLSIDRSLFTREAILKKQKQLEILAAERDRLTDVSASKEVDYSDAISDEEQALKELEQYGDLEAEADEKVTLEVQEGRQEFASIIKDLPTVQGELKDLGKQIASGIAEISPDWGETDIKVFDVSIASRKKVQQFEASLTKAEQEMGILNARAESLKTEQQGAQAKLEEKAKKLTELGEDTGSDKQGISMRRASLRLLRGSIADKEKLETTIGFEERRLNDKRKQQEDYSQSAAQSKVPMKLFTLVVGGIGIVLSLVFLATRRFDLAIISFMVAAVLAAALFWVNKSAGKKLADEERTKRVRLSEIETDLAGIASDLEQMRADYSAIDQQVRGLVTSLALSACKPQDMDALETQLNEEQAIHDRKVLLRDEQEEWKTTVEKTKQALEALEKKGKETEASLKARKQKWQEYLRMVRLPDDIEPRTMDFIFAKVETIKGKFNEAVRLEERITKMEEARRKYLQILEGIPSLAQDIDKESIALLSSVDSFLRKTREINVKRGEKDAAEKIAIDRTNRRVEAERVLLGAREELDNKVAEEATATEAWSTWISARGFSDQISPPTGLDALARISDCIKLIKERTSEQNRVNGLLETIGDYQELTKSCALAIGRQAPENDKIAGYVDSLGQEYEQTKTNSTRKAALQRNLESTGRKIKALERTIEEQRSQLHKLLQAGGANNEEDFRVRARLFEEEQELQSSIRQTEANIRKISGEEDTQSLRVELEALSLDGLRSTQDECRILLDAIDGELQMLREQKAALEQSLSVLSSTDDISSMRAEEEALLEEIRILSLEWGRNAFAKALLIETKGRFEQEQQPKVINDAGTFLDGITGGKYQKIVAPLGENTIEIMDAQKERKRPEHFSRGTAEQVYLAIRFGYIKNRTANGETLPIIMDDVLVNFDPRRAVSTTQTILSLAETQQVFYFTCHPETVNLFREVRHSVPIYRLEQGKIVAT
jgi:uncharacterized protein YhaN